MIFKIFENFNLVQPECCPVIIYCFILFNNFISFFSNSIVDCSQIGKFDYLIWKDPTCGQPVHWNTYGS